MGRRRRVFRVGAASLLALVAVIGRLSAEEPAADPRAESTRRMAARLEAIAVGFERDRRLNRSRYFHVNRPWVIPAYRARLQNSPGPKRSFDLGYKLARELLWDGRSEEAFQEFTRILEISMATGEQSPGADRTRALLQRWRALAQLRIGEQRHCIAQHNPDTCLFPIEGGGVHADQTGSRGAIAILSEGLEKDGDDLAGRWLLNLAYMTVGEYPDGVPAAARIPPSAFASEYATPRFVDAAARSGTDVMGLAGGAAVEDFDGDGHLDIVASSWGLRDQVRLLRSDGDGRFTDRTLAAGLEGEVGGLNLNHADYDNDGDADLLILRGGWLGAAGAIPNSLLRNEGGAVFRDVTSSAGLGAELPSQTAAWGDFDGDGWLDLFVGTESKGADAYPCQLFHNDGDGTFTDVASAVGLADLGFAKGAAWGDFDNDGRPDLYVSRMGQPNLLFRNLGPGADGAAWRFEEVGQKAGVREPRFSFPTWFFDYDNDGWLDLFVGAWDGADVAAVAAGYLGRLTGREHPRLYRNRGDGTFGDVTKKAGLDRVLLAMGANFGDIDNDGFLDVYVGTGAPEMATLMPNRMFRNDAGRAFLDVTTAGGFGHLQKGHGIAFGDLDHDGDQDVYAVLGGWYTGDAFHNALFENPGGGGHHLTVRLHGVRSNRMGVGARIDVTVATEGGERRIHRTVGTGGSFGSSSLQQEIGLGDAGAISLVRVHWPASGVTQEFRDVPLDRVIEVREDAKRPRIVTVEPFALGPDAAGSGASEHHEMP